MGLLDKQNAEKLKYINAIKFMNLIAFTTKESIENIVSYLVNEDFEKKVSSYHIDRHARISQNNHTQGFGFDVNTRKFLDNCYSYSFFDNYIYYGDVNKVEGDFYYLIDELKSVDFITSLAINFDSLKDVERAVTAWHKEQQNPIYRIFKPSFEKPNYDQVDYMKQDSFSIMDAAGLLAGVSVIDIEQYRNHPKFTELYADYISYKLMIELALTNKELNYKHDSISAIDLQEYLFKMGYIIKGFNDWLTIEPAKPLIDNKSSEQLGASHNELKEAKAKITDLENQLAQAKADLADKPAIINNDKNPYTTPAIDAMNAVIAEFWIDYSPDQPAPKQSTITKWITDHFDGVSNALALNIDKVCRHSDAKSGGQYKR